MITISNKTLRSIGAHVDGEYIKFPVSALPNESRPESSNDGNYREYAEFISGTNEFRYTMSYHGDIEPFPKWEKVPETTWACELMSAVLAALSLKNKKEV